MKFVWENYVEWEEKFFKERVLKGMVMSIFWNMSKDKKGRLERL